MLRNTGLAATRRSIPLLFERKRGRGGRGSSQCGLRKNLRMISRNLCRPFAIEYSWTFSFPLRSPGQKRERRGILHCYTASNNGVAGEAGEKGHSQQHRQRAPNEQTGATERPSLQKRLFCRIRCRLVSYFPSEAHPQHTSMISEKRSQMKREAGSPPPPPPPCPRRDRNQRGRSVSHQPANYHRPRHGAASKIMIDSWMQRREDDCSFRENVAWSKET